MKGPFFYVLVPSGFGDLSIVWRKKKTGPRVCQIFLPSKHVPVQNVVHVVFPDAKLLSRPAITELSEQMNRFLLGDAVDFGLTLLELDRCSEFQQRVLLAKHKIPRGWVSTYGRIAKSLESPGGARAVGNALARNPFPIIIPCHRAVKADGELGGYQGGLKMKRALLEMEGIEVSPAGKVLVDRFYY
ncbi:MAG: methylated-DNA--[protein]-cysteine S-methyltransferase [Chloroflexi bacterium]|nr:methylated-DNA--[protein]-cysteine S-methyltransferase [Chloroflexota bacterium]